jgi:ankyrin repeat protein
MVEDHIENAPREEIRDKLIEHAKTGNYDEIEKLIMLGHGSMEARDPQGCSILSISCKHNHFSCAEKLISFLNCNINTKDQKGWTPLMIAAFHNHARILRLLIKYNADP